MTMCSVFWCIDEALPKRSVCRIHAARPVKTSIERRDDYFQRLFGEDAANRAAARRRSTLAAKDVEVSLIAPDIGSEPDITRPKGY